MCSCKFSRFALLHYRVRSSVVSLRHRGHDGWRMAADKGQAGRVRTSVQCVGFFFSADRRMQIQAAFGLFLKGFLFVARSVLGMG